MKIPSPLVGLISILSAAPSVAAEKNAKVPVAIFSPAYAEGLKSVFVKSGTDTYQSVALSTANVIEGEEAMIEEGRISLYGPAAGDGGHPTVATVELGEIRRPLLVIQPNGEGAQPAYQANVVEADLPKFPLGSFKFVNLSPNPVRVSYGNDVIEIESGADSLFKPDVPDGEVAAVTIDYKSAETWALLSSARWASRKDRRTLVCFQLDPSTKRMVVKSVPLREKSK